MSKVLISGLFLASCLAFTLGHTVRHERGEDDSWMHPRRPALLRQDGKQVEDANHWQEAAQAALVNKIESDVRIAGQAKNVIFFLGDGMSVPTITAARILKGQKVDNLDFGEEAELHIDTFPNTGVSKTFCADSQVADSACSATAYLCGTKANIGTIGVTPAVLSENCALQADSKNHVTSILAWAQAAGKATGIVTTTRITHASPAGTYAHIAEREWENDGEITDSEQDAALCDDIAKQLILSEPGKNFNVILGGGRRQFLPTTETDPESNEAGFRRDGMNLINMWKDAKKDNVSFYITEKTQLLEVNTAETEYLLGLFSPDHLGYLDEQEELKDPSLEEMTTVAIEILRKNPNGFFLFVEGGRIDHAHHDNFGQRALWETIEFDKAIKKGDDMTVDQDTLIVVTADHAHVMTIAGYPVRGNSILGLADIADDHLPFGTIGYANGPGYREYTDGVRPDITNDPVEEITYQQPSPVPIYSETHGGDDVLIFSKGPFAHLLTGVQQQSYIPHVIGYAACVGSGIQYCQGPPEVTTTTSGNTDSTSESTATEANNGVEAISHSLGLALSVALFSFLTTRF